MLRPIQVNKVSYILNQKDKPTVRKHRLPLREGFEGCELLNTDSSLVELSQWHVCRGKGSIKGEIPATNLPIFQKNVINVQFLKNNHFLLLFFMIAMIRDLFEKYLRATF